MFIAYDFFLMFHFSYMLISRKFLVYYQLPDGTLRYENKVLKVRGSKSPNLFTQPISG